MTVHSKIHYNTEVLNSIPIREVVSHFEKTTRKGSTQFSLCPWHDDHNPSLALYESSSENRCHCFACGKGGSNIDYVMQHENCTFLEACQILSERFHCGVEETQSYYQALFKPKAVEKVQIEEEEKAPTFIPESYLDSIQSNSSSFCNFMKHYFDPMRIDHLAEEYKLGITDYYGYEDDVVFPSIDIDDKIHNLKVQHYETDVTSPNFGHCQRNHVYWLGSTLAKKGILPADSVFDNDCLFGAHLLNKYPQNIVALVESPKNAICGAAAYPEYVWVATGSSGQLKESVINCLKNRQVMVFPDRDATDDWRKKLAEFEYLACFEVFSDWQLIVPDCDKKYDIADYILAQRPPVK